MWHWISTQSACDSFQRTAIVTPLLHREGFFQDAGLFDFDLLPCCHLISENEYCCLCVELPKQLCPSMESAADMAITTKVEGNFRAQMADFTHIDQLIIKYDGITSKLPRISKFLKQRPNATFKEKHSKYQVHSKVQADSSHLINIYQENHKLFSKGKYYKNVVIQSNVRLFLLQ